MKIIIALTLSLLAFSALAAKKNIYTIEKGEHSSKGTNLGLFIGKILSVDVRFDNSAIYNLGNTNQGDINKLIGFSDCFSHHHKNSARLGWRWSEEKQKVEIFAYTYAKGKRAFKWINDVVLNEKFTMKIKVSKNMYYFTVGAPGVGLERGCNSKSAFGYKLFPYFGGDEVAPNDVNIYVKNLGSNKN